MNPPTLTEARAGRKSIQMTTTPKTVKHTPGPWQVCHNVAYSAPCVCGPNGFGDPTIATLIAPGHFLREDETPEQRAEANAKLIAAAPDMLAALQKMSADFASGKNLSEAIQAVDAAIAKATS